ncbi:MAG: GyrI-like domain-containing protein [Bacteroidota bacterium]
MNIEFIDIPDRVFIGRSLTLPLQSHDVFALWQQFRKEQLQSGIIDVQLISMQSYHEWPPTTAITHVACLEKKQYQEYPKDWCEYIIKGGVYATFEYSGGRSEFPSLLKHVILEILPTTNYSFDPSRYQFQIMPAEYSLSDPQASESVYIPVI